MALFESKEIQWNALYNAKNALQEIKGLQAKLEAIIESEQICHNYPRWVGSRTDKEEAEYQRLIQLHISEEVPTALRRAANSIRQMRKMQEEQGETNCA